MAELYPENYWCSGDDSTERKQKRSSQFLQEGSDHIFRGDAVVGTATPRRLDFKDVFKEIESDDSDDDNVDNSEPCRIENESTSSGEEKQDEANSHDEKAEDPIMVEESAK